MLQKDTRWIRRMLTRELPEIAELAKQNPDSVWTEKDFSDQKNSVVMLSERNDIIEGFVVYELHPNRIQLTNIVVRDGLRRNGIGRKLIELLIGKLHPEHKNRIVTIISEMNLTGQLFFRSMGFRAVQVLKPLCEHERDAYIMRYRKTNP